MIRPEDVDAELVEKAAEASFREQTRYAFGGEEPGWSDEWPDWDPHDEAFGPFLNETRHALAAVLPDIQAQALRELADDMTAEYEARTAKVGAYGQTKIRAALLTGAGYARDRADRLTATPEDPTTPVHVGGRVNAEDCPACSPDVDPPPYPWVCPGPTEEPTT